MINLLSKFLTVLLCLCFAPMLKGQDFVKVDLQDGFDEDTVSLYVNDIEIFKNQILTSSFLTSEVGFNILFTRRKLGSYFITQFYPFENTMPSGTSVYKRANMISGFYQMDLKDKDDSCIWRFKVVMNQDTLAKSIDIGKYEYIGITKYGDLEDPFKEGLSIVESKIAFYYD
jgi:hypothetical protein